MKNAWKFHWSDLKFILRRYKAEIAGIVFAALLFFILSEFVVSKAF